MPKEDEQQFKDDPLWTREQMADYCHVSTTTVRRLQAEGTLPVVRIRGAVRVRRSVVEAYLESLESAGSPS